MRLYLCILLSSLLLVGCSRVGTEILIVDNPIGDRLKYSFVEEIEEVEVESGIGKVIIEGLVEEPFYETTNNRRYVYHDLNGDPTSAGPVFMDENCKTNSSNLILYGHSSTKREILFTNLMVYLKKDVINEYPFIELHYDEDIVKYQIFSVYLINSKDTEHAWLQTDFQKGYLYDLFIETIKSNSIYNIDVKKSNQVVTLVTCYTEDNKYRLIIHGMKVV